MWGFLAAAAAGAALSQTQVTGPRFDVVSIRPSPPDARGGGFNLSPGRLNGKNVNLNELVRFAYDLHGYQVSGDTAWMDTDHFEILATFPASTTDSQRAQMMQAMLADRFALEVHRGSKEVSGYALVAGKNGTKLHPAESAERGLILGRSATSGQRTLHGNSAGMPALASILADVLGRPVEDKTGLAGVFDFAMEWTPDPLSEAPLRKGADQPAPPADGQTGPSIFTAIQEQLGLKLEAGKVAVGTIAIDHAEKPTAN